jgi:hypothetical protein
MRIVSHSPRSDCFALRRRRSPDLRRCHPVPVPDAAGWGSPAPTGRRSSASVPRNFPIAGQWRLDQAVGSFNFTLTNTAGPGFPWPAGRAQPNIDLNYSATRRSRTRGRLGTGGAITTIPGVSGSNLLIDVNGRLVSRIN